jgi:hypothetical protein
VAAGKTTAAAQDAWLCFEDESGQGLRPPKGCTWGRRGHTPVVSVRGGGTGRVNLAGLVCYRPGHGSRLIYRTHVYHGRAGEPKALQWTDYRDLLVAAHQQVGAPIVLVWDNLSVHKVPPMQAFIDEHADWLTVFHLPTYAPELNPAEGHLVDAQGEPGQLRGPRPEPPHQGRGTAAEDDPVPGVRSGRMPDPDRTDHAAPLTDTPGHRPLIRCTNRNVSMWTSWPGCV